MTKKDGEGATLPESEKPRSKSPGHVEVVPKVTKGPDYRVVYASGAFGGLDLVEGRIIFYVDRLIPKAMSGGVMQLDNVERELQVEIHMSPLAFKSLATWIDKHAEKVTIEGKKEE